MEGLFGWIVISVLLVVPLWKICARAGFPPALSLLALVPWLGFLIVAAVLGFTDWPRVQGRRI